MPPSWRPREGGLISLLGHSTAASPFVFSVRKEQRHSLTGPKHCSLQAARKQLSLEPSLLLLQWGLSFLPIKISCCYSDLWCISFHHSNPFSQTSLIPLAPFSILQRNPKHVVTCGWKPCSGQLAPCSTSVTGDWLLGKRVGEREEWNYAGRLKRLKKN